jgi:transposase
MRGTEEVQDAMFSYISAEQRVPKDHPLRPIRRIMDEVLKRLSPEFEQMYSTTGRPSIAPERLLRAMVLQALYTVRSERMLMEQLNYNLLFRWFVGLNMDDSVWDATVFSKNRDRLLQGDIAQAFFQAVLKQARRLQLLSDEHFTVDGTLLEAWASQKSYQKKQTPPQQGSGSRGAMLLRDTHESKTDPDAVMYRKSSGGACQLSHMAHVVMENRSGLPVAAKITACSPQAEWEAALEMMKAITGGNQRATLGGDKAYDAAGFVAALREMKVTPHVHQYEGMASHIDQRTTRHPSRCITEVRRASAST